MIGVIDCYDCIHKLPLIDGWRSCCTAFPNGIPLDFDYSQVKKIKECNNGIGYEQEKQNNLPLE